jgi:hypothetical protein
LAAKASRRGRKLIQESTEKSHSRQCGNAIQHRLSNERPDYVLATNAAGGRAVLAHGYSVASNLNFQGFAAPLAATPTLNVISRRSYIPIKWSLPDGNGGYASNFASFRSLSATPMTCPSKQTNSVTGVRVGGGLSYETTTNSFVYTRQAPNAAVWEDVRITLGDGSTHDLWFRIQ